MATLSTGNSYELSQCSAVNQSNYEYVYMKLTDSALRAIEEYAKNQNTLASPTVQFIQNDGILSFPTANGEQKFSFQLQETTDLQGPQGSFECVQQNSQKQLKTLGTLPFKMRIQANDDVYESTKTKMAKETENSKNKCTREIKPNQTDIGRKVKLKPGASRFNNIPVANNLHQQTKRDPYSMSSNNNFNSLPASNGNQVPHAATNTSNNFNLSKNSNSSHHHYLSPVTNGVVTPLGQTPTQQQQQQTTNNNKPVNSSSQQLHHTTGTHLNNNNSLSVSGMSGNGLVPSRAPVASQQHSRNQNRSSNPAIMKRPIKDRLIHLLALRPINKLLIYDKLARDGIKDKDKQNVATVLKNISYMRDNVYHLHRHIWNDVQEDWPFYNEQDRQTLKRRKPQNLTPPLSSDSLGSGHSPDSAHNGSPPPPIKRPLSKDISQCEGPVSKKQRISHYKKPEAANHDTISSKTPNALESEDSGLCISYSVMDTENAIRNGLSVPGVFEDPDHTVERNLHDGLEGDADEFSNTFTRITCVEQRRKYKHIFDTDFEEYRDLNRTVNEALRTITELENEFNLCEENDQRHRIIESLILKEYNSLKNNKKFMEKQQRYTYLHRKLSYIKQLVHDYDVSITTQAQDSLLSKSY